MTKVLVLGAGRIGVSIAQVLAGTGDYRVTLGEGMAEPAAAGGLGALATVDADNADMEPEPVESDGDDEDYAVAV